MVIIVAVTNRRQVGHIMAIDVSCSLQNRDVEIRLLHYSNSELVHLNLPQDR